MNFERIKHFANSQDIRHLTLHPEYLFKYYAESCTITEWLRIYKSNKIAAKWMNQWLPFRILVNDGHIDLLSWYSDDTSNLPYFIESEKLTTVLSIDAWRISELRASLRNLTNLTEVNIIVNNYGAPFLDLQFPNLSKITISSDRAGEWILPLVRVSSGLFELIEICRCAIAVYSIEWILDVHVDKLKFKEIVGCDQNIEPIFTMLFSNVRELSLDESYRYKTDPFFSLHTYELISFDSNVIESLHLNISRDFIDIQNIYRMPYLKKLTLKLYVHDYISFLNLMKCLVLLKNESLMIIIHIRLTGLSIFDALMNKRCTYCIYKMIRKEILLYISWNSNVLFFFETY